MTLPFESRLRRCAGALCVVALLAAGRAGVAQAAAQARARQSAAATLTATDQASLTAALANYESGQAALAQPVLARLAARYPGNATVQAAAGMATLESGDLAHGMPYLRQAHRLNPHDAGVTENLGIALLHLGQPAQALPLLQQARRAQHANLGAFMGEAQALMALHRYQEAADAFAAAIEHAGAADNTADLHHDCALALLNANRPQQAVDVLLAQTDLSTSGPAQELLGEAEEKLGHYNSAFTHFKRAAELDPSESNLFAYGNELLQHWTFPAAIDIFQFGRSRYPASDRLYTGLGVAYFGNNDFPHAAEVFHAQLAAQPGNTSMADLLGRSCSAAVSAEVAGCDELVRFADAHPQNAAANLYAAIALLHDAGNPANSAKAEALLKQALATDPKLAEAWYQLAVLQQQRMEWAESAASLERAVALKPGYAEAHYRLARAYGHIGRKNEAQQQIALQRQSAQSAQDADTKRMQEVMTFLTANK